MSFRPPFSAPNTTFPPPPFNNNLAPSANNAFVCQPNENYQPRVPSNYTNYNNMNPPNINRNLCLNSNALTPPVYEINKPNQQLMPPNNFHNNAFGSRQQPINRVPVPYSNSINTCPGGIEQSVPQPRSFDVPYNNFYSNPNVQQNPRRNPINSNEQFSCPGQRVSNCNPSRIVNLDNFQGYQNNASPIFNSFPQNSMAANADTSNKFTVNNSVPTPTISNIQVAVPMNGNNFFTVPSVLSNLSHMPSPPLKNVISFNVPPPTLGNDASHTSFSSNIQNPLLSEKELKLTNFLSKFTATKKKSENKITVPEFRSTLKCAFSIMKMLSQHKLKLASLIDASESDWNSGMKCIINMKKQLSELCSLLSSPDHLNRVVKKLQFIKKKREQKKKTKLNKLSEKIKAEQNRKELNQEIDKWLDDLKEKNLKLKREVEMKKEADFILLEVRRKIQEANRTIEKIKVFEKLRNARQANAVQKGLHILSGHNEKFEKKVSILKETMLRQLSDYEAEEKALKVMLETEQEGQLEEEAQWELKKLKTRQQKRQNHIMECLFGISDDPLPTDPLYLFHKYHTSANNSVENLVQIRHFWDVHMAEDGETVPQQWVVPAAPSNSMWEKCLATSKS